MKESTAALFGTDWEYRKAQQQQRKQERSKREERKNRKGQWTPLESEAA